MMIFLFTAYAFTAIARFMLCRTYEFKAADELPRIPPDDVMHVQPS